MGPADHGREVAQDATVPQPALPSRTEPPALCVTAAIPEAVRQLRYFARRIADHWGLDLDSVDALCLIVSEYATNAAKHSGGTCMALLLSRSGRTITVQLRDNGHWKRPRQPIDGESGRGLPIVRACTTVSGCHRTATGTTAWAQLVASAGGMPC